jgi:hypothetical protein
MPADTNSLEYFYGEYYFFLILREAGSAVLAGITTPAIRRERIREAILATGRAEEVLSANKKGLVETFAERWSRFYGLPFYPIEEDQPLETVDAVT